MKRAMGGSATKKLMPNATSESRVAGGVMKWLFRMAAGNPVGKHLRYEVSCGLPFLILTHVKYEKETDKKRDG
jgi:hypothetical protein